PTPAQDFGLMYNRHIEDPDGYVWEIVWMNPAA
ncbi:lactoylglutathione lyase, partial [Mesorhizobium sp. M4B.F.Ca.ET.017.02.2.1]